MAPLNLSLFLLVILPGFLLITVFSAVGRYRKLDTFYATVFSLISSLALVALTHLLYSRLCFLCKEKFPDLGQILFGNTLPPSIFWLYVYVAALVVGWVLGNLDRKRVFERVLRSIGIDLPSHGDVWRRVMRDADYIRVYLKDGFLLTGWPRFYSYDRQGQATELFLSNVFYRNASIGNWEKLGGVEGVLLDQKDISRIELLEQPKPEQKPQQ